MNVLLVCLGLLACLVFWLWIRIETVAARWHKTKNTLNELDSFMILYSPKYAQFVKDREQARKRDKQKGKEE